MTVKELIEELKKFPEDMPIALYNEDADNYNVVYFYPKEVDATMCKKKDDLEWILCVVKAVGL